MSEWILATLLGLLILADFLFLLAAYSLRVFSRSRLDDICRLRGRESRFSDILKRDDDAQVVCDIMATVLTGALVGWALTKGNLLEATSPDGWQWFLHAISLLSLLFGVVFFAMIFPWMIARVGGERFLYFFWPCLRLLLTLFGPLLAMIHRLDQLIHRMSGKQQSDNGDAASITEEIRTVVDEGQREGALEHEARTMIHRVMELRDEDTASIMTPRTDMVCIRSDATLEEARETLLEAGHSRVPVIGKTTDDIVGILYAKDLLRYVNTQNGQQAELKDIVREPYYVPETSGLDNLLEMMKRKRVHMAIVVDEYGGVAGLVSMEDILEEIVGEIVDEYDDAEETGIVTISPDIVEVDARVHIDDLNEQFPFELPEDADYDTIGGFVFRQLGRVPVKDDTFTWKQLQVTVLGADKRRIHKVRLELDKSLAESNAQNE